MKPFLLKPALKDYIWGGNSLRAFGKVSAADRIAESWELSCHPEGECRIASGDFAGRTLTDFLREFPQAAGENCRQFREFPMLVKLIDAHDELSVQVHPDDAYAMAHGGGLGKTELWYIIDAKPGAEILYGMKEPMSQADFQQSIEDNTLLDKLRHVPVRAGDVFFIPAGTLHAVGRGILLAEIQENSNTTYRVYDYGRGRELHIAQALDVTNLRPVETEPLSRPARIDGWKAQHLSDCAYFYASLWETETQAEETWRFGGDTASFLHILVLDGSGALYTADGDCLPLSKGTSLFIPAGSQSGEIIGNLRFITTEVYQEQ
ncbi:MAG: class I mannose-6-phosphate isomerase [Oscillospiraceae bacterium]|nr:class I mannose-6-phosphate isomerase [Oscillospiraceae bacterium]